MTDEQLIDGLRASLQAATADLHAPRHLLDGIAPRRALRGRLPSGGVVLTLAGVAAAVAVIVAALLTLAHPGPSATTPAAPRPSGPVVTTLRGLRGELSLLRRPQRPADRLPAWSLPGVQRPYCGSCLTVTRVMAGETRLLTRLPLRRRGHTMYGPRAERVYLVIGGVPPRYGNNGWHQTPRQLAGPHLTIVGLAGRHAHLPTPMDELLNGVALPMPPTLLSPRDVMIGLNFTVGVVPDGVARVRWVLTNPGQGAPKIVYPRLHGNVAVAPWTPSPPHYPLLNEQWLAGATWYARDGRVLATFDDLRLVNRNGQGGS